MSNHINVASLAGHFRFSALATKVLYRVSLMLRYFA